MIIPRMIATLIIASMTKMLRGYCTLPRKKLLKYSFLFMAWSIIIVSKFQSFFFDMNMNVISHNIKTYGITTSNIRHVDAESFAEAFWYFTCEKFSVILTVTLSFYKSSIRQVLSPCPFDEDVMTLDLVSITLLSLMVGIPSMTIHSSLYHHFVKVSSKTMWWWLHSVRFCCETVLITAIWKFYAFNLHYVWSRAHDIYTGYGVHRWGNAHQDLL